MPHPATTIPRSIPPSGKSTVGRKRQRPKLGRNPTPSKLFASNLFIAVERSGLSNAELAEKVGVTPGAVSQWIAGTAIPHIDYWPKLASALGLKDSSELVTF